MILISEVLRQAREYLLKAESFKEEYRRYYRDGGNDLASNVKIYDYPDDDILDKLTADLNPDEKQIVISAIEENKCEYAESGIQSLWQWYLESEAEHLIEYTQGCCIDVKYYREQLHNKPCPANWRAYSRELMFENMVNLCKDGGFNGRSGGWFMFGRSDDLCIDEIQNILSFITTDNGKINTNEDYDYLNGELMDLLMYIEQGKKALRSFEYISGYIKRAKKNLVKDFIDGELKGCRIPEALSEYYETVEAK